MNPNLLIIGSFALNFHHFNFDKANFKPIRTINDLDLIVSKDFLQFYLDSHIESESGSEANHNSGNEFSTGSNHSATWKVTLQNESKNSLKKSYLFQAKAKLPQMNNLAVYVEFDIADGSGNSNDLALEYAKHAGYPTLSFEQSKHILDCVIENFAKNLIAERNLAHANATYRYLSKQYHIPFTNQKLEQWKYTQIINPKNIKSMFEDCIKQSTIIHGETNHHDNSDSVAVALPRSLQLHDVIADLPLLHVIKSAHKYQKFEHVTNGNGLNNSHKFEKTKSDIMLINELLFNHSVLNKHSHNPTNTMNKSDFVQYYVFECEEKRIQHLSKPTYKLNYQNAQNVLLDNLGLVLSRYNNGETVYQVTATATSTPKDNDNVSNMVIKLYKSLCDFYQLREKESYLHKLPNLNVDKGDFFKKDEVNYIYDHDSIHEAIALFVKQQLESNVNKQGQNSSLFTKEFLDGYYVNNTVSLKKLPAYTKYMKDDADVMTDADKFFQQNFQTQILGVVEETMVLALERFCFQPQNKKLLRSGSYHQVKLPKYAFEFCLKKVCTTITSGYFREFAYIYYFEALKVYHELNPSEAGNEFYLFVNDHLDMLKPFSV